MVIYKDKKMTQTLKKKAKNFKDCTVLKGSIFLQ